MSFTYYTDFPVTRHMDLMWLQKNNTNEHWFHAADSIVHLLTYRPIIKSTCMKHTSVLLSRSLELFKAPGDQQKNKMWDSNHYLSVCYCTLNNERKLILRIHKNVFCFATVHKITFCMCHSFINALFWQSWNHLQIFGSCLHGAAQNFYEANLVNNRPAASGSARLFYTILHFCKHLYRGEASDMTVFDGWTRMLIS